jgi:hypothetical protein
MKPALYVLGGIALMFGLFGLEGALIWAFNRLFGEYGILAWGLMFMAIGGGCFGWIVYRIRNRP